MANPQHKMEAMAQTYGLKDGKYADFYNLHGQWCVTKNGAKKIARQEGITHNKPDGEMGDCIVYFSAVFSDKKGRSAWEIGSCRFDGTKMTPERSHAPEMAVKRMFVRGVLALIEADGIYGADEFDSEFSLIKGGGGALTREKIVAAVADKFVCIADESKLVDVMGEFPLPIEVIPMSANYVTREIVKKTGATVKLRDFTTDNGNLILDVYDLKITDPKNLETELNSIVGIVTNGLFANRPADILLLGTPTGVKKV
jgi:hypothetical protein